MRTQTFRAAIVVALLAAGAAGCTEKLESGAGCPELCTGQGAEIQTLTLEPIVLDTTVSAANEFATETSMMTANRGDTVDSRAIIRFDSIPTFYIGKSGDTVVITTVDSAFLTLHLDLRGAILPDSVRIDLFDVDTPDPDQTSVAAQFTADRVLGSAVVAKADFKDSLKIFLNNSIVLGKTAGKHRLRVGVRPGGGTQFGVLASESSLPAHLSFRVSADTTVRPLVLTPLSLYPANDPGRSSAFSDYALPVKIPAIGAPTNINVGGYPQQIAYMRFQIPSMILDSAIVVRAQLILTQIPNPALGPGDTITVIPVVGAAANTVTDIARAARITLDRATAAVDSIRIPSREGGTRILEIANAIGAWRLQPAATTPRVLVLHSGAEGVAVAEARFYSMEAAPQLRPRLQISYSPRTSFGRP